MIGVRRALPFFLPSILPLPTLPGFRPAGRDLPAARTARLTSVRGGNNGDGEVQRKVPCGLGQSRRASGKGKLANFQRNSSRLLARQNKSARRPGGGTGPPGASCPFATRLSDP